MQNIIISGLKFETTNARTIETEGADFLATFEKFQELEIENTLPSGRIFVVYTNYEADFASDIMNKKYTVYIGMEVEAENPSLQNFTIPASNYMVIESEEGIEPEEVGEIWEEVWEDEELTAKRSFIADYEVYEGTENEDELKVKVFIGINQ